MVNSFRACERGIVARSPSIGSGQRRFAINIVRIPADFNEDVTRSCLNLSGKCAVYCNSESRKRLNYVQHIPSRLRIRSELIRGNERGALAAEARIRPLHGVKSVTASALTGSITVLYDARLLPAEALLSKLREHGHATHAVIPVGEDN